MPKSILEASIAVYHVYCAGAPMSAEKANQVLEMMEEAFPPAGRRTREAQRALMEHPLYQVCTAEANGKVQAFMALWTLRKMTFFEHFAVNRKLQADGVGGEMLRWLAERYAPCVLETEPPENENARRRIAFFERHGLHLNRQAYDRLPMRPGSVKTPMCLMSCPEPLSDGMFHAARREIYRHAYGAEEV